MKDFSYNNGYFAVSVEKGMDVEKTFEFKCACFDCKVQGIAKLDSVKVTENGNTIALYKKRGSDKTAFSLNNKFVCGNCSRTYIMEAFRTNVTQWYMEDLETVDKMIAKVGTMKSEKAKKNAIEKANALRNAIENDYLSAFQDALDELAENRQAWLSKQAEKQAAKEKSKESKKANTAEK